MHSVLITGAGKVGSLIACLLATANDYEVHLADLHFQGSDFARLLKACPQIQTICLDVKDHVAVQSYLQKNQITAVISCLPYFLNSYVAQAAKSADTYYFDLAEDTATTAVVKAIASDAKRGFVPQCGLAPGFISIVANTLMQEFEICLQAKLRVGALPKYSSNALHYSLTWSTEGLINEYGNPCHGLQNSSPTLLAPLEGLETIQIDGCEYEAFHTSGGIGSLTEIYDGKVQTLNYKTIRYPGHCEKIRFLMNELKLNEDRAILKRILENALPKTYDDLVLIYVSVEGLINQERLEKNYVKKILPQTIQGLRWSAIQVATATSACAVVDIILNQPERAGGLILQEQIALNDFLTNRFGIYFV